MDETIKKAARIVKIQRLCSMPGMDEIAVRLNSEPTFAEIREAKIWHAAFAAERNKNGD